MEKIENNKQNMVTDKELEQVAAGTLTFDRLHTLLFGGHSEEEAEETVSNDESGAWGGW